MIRDLTVVLLLVGRELLCREALRTGKLICHRLRNAWSERCPPFLRCRSRREQDGIAVDLSTLLRRQALRDTRVP